MIRTQLLYGCETWALRTIEQKKIQIFDNDCLRRILRVRRSDCIPIATIQSICGLQSTPSIILQRRLRWFGHVARRAPDDLLYTTLRTSPCETWHKRSGGQNKTWLTTIKQDLSLISGPTVYGLRTWNRNWLQLSINLAQDRRAWSATVRDAVNNRVEASNIRPG